MAICVCRSCGRQLNEDTLLHYENMPPVAQYLPDEKGCLSELGIELDVVQCRYCGLIQLTCEPVPYYREVIRASAVSAEMTKYRFEQFSALVDRFSLKGKKVLECGCGGGEFLSIMKMTGAECFGMEYSEDNLAKCRSAGLPVECEYFETGNEVLKNGPFDAFFILNYLEHLPDLQSYLAGISNNLKDGAVGLVEVPDFDMMMTNHTFAEFMRDHLSYFTRQSLRTLLENNGFDVLSMENTFHNYVLSAVIKKRTVADLSGFLGAQNRICGKLHEIVSVHGAENCALWGASHQAFAILALAQMKGQLRCIIDSADFKQGKYSPVTHIKIVSPDSVKKGDISLLIVAAGGYSSEVAKIARNRFGDIDIYVLRENKLEKYNTKAQER